MDSELLSVFRDDQFDSGGNKFEENYWNIVNCENFATHLSDNLNGILPISPIEEKNACFSADLHDCNYSNNVEISNINIANQDQNFSYSGIDSNIEIISVDPNVEFDDAEFDDSESERDKYENKKNNYEIDTDNESQITFRSRTDSSSIGDYESHTSDESEVEYSNKSNFNSINQAIYIEEENKKKYSIDMQDIEHDVNSRNDTIISHIDFIGSSIMVATNNSNQSIEIDTETFDLATFITEDNFIQEKLSENSSVSNERHLSYNYGYESEEIIDIETIDDRNQKNTYSKVSLKPLTKNEVDEHTSTLNTNHYFEEDDIKGDPSWDPTCEKKNKNCTEKGNEKLSNKNKENNINKNLMKETKTTNSLLTKKKTKKKMKNEDKKVPIFKQSFGYKVPISATIDNFNVMSTHLDLFEKDEKNSINKEKQNFKGAKSEAEHLPNTNLEVPTKKKLNLEEYYKMRQSEQKDVTNKVASTHLTAPFKIIATPATSIKPHKEKEQFSIENLSNSKSLLIPKEKFKINSKISHLDPITEAKNKVLRIQEMKKRAAQKRLIDITVSSKVGPITKILPLEEIIKPNLKNFNKEKLKFCNLREQIEYEEIIIVSVSSNTDIKIPPIFDKIPVNNTSTSLLYNISSTIEKVKCKENLKISNNSLITSIKNVVLQKTVQDNKKNEDKIINESKFKTHKKKQNLYPDKISTEEHGEDKIIMHLPKNRIKKQMVNVASQTESLPEFPSLELIIPKVVRAHYNRGNKNRKYKYKKEEYSSLSSNSDRESDGEFVNIRSNRHRSHSRSTGDGSRQMSPSNNYTYQDAKFKSDLCDLNRNHNRSRRKLRANIYRTRNFSGSGHSTSSSYRSRSSSYSDRSDSRSNRNYVKKDRRSKSNHYRNYKKTKNKDCRSENSPAVEERRIVYVGRIEAETTKEDLKRKFIVYGPIKQITLHYKDTGMKYGFVTFERAEDAFKAIDNGTSDNKINMYDISFGGRRAFCRQSYADLDGAATNTFQLYSYGSVPSSRNSLLSNNDEDDSFESLLKKVKQKLCSSKPSSQNI